MNKKLIIGIIIVAVVIIGIILINIKTTTRTPINAELVSKYTVLKNNAYLQSKPYFVQLETEIEICEGQSFITYLHRPLKDISSMNGDWQKISVIDCGPTYYIGDISNTGSKLFGPFGFE